MSDISQAYLLNFSKILPWEWGCFSFPILKSVLRSFSKALRISWKFNWSAVFLRWLPWVQKNVQLLCQWEMSWSHSVFDLGEQFRTLSMDNVAQKKICFANLKFDVWLLSYQNINPSWSTGRVEPTPLPSFSSITFDRDKILKRNFG